MKTALYFLALTWPGLALAKELPVPPVPPDNPPFAEPAPIPDVDARPPILPADHGAKLDVRFYRARSFDPSMGFAPGSRYQSTEDRKAIQTPGFSVTVPLH